MEALCAAVDTSALGERQDDVLTAGAGFAVADENGFSFTQSGASWRQCAGVYRFQRRMNGRRPPSLPCVGLAG